jgi:predicted RNA-binding Zn-ribbon protein involved in translation (DUF1610 family)
MQRLIVLMQKLIVDLLHKKRADNFEIPACGYVIISNITSGRKNNE